MQENIEAVLRPESEYLSRRTTADRLADGVARFAGSLWFVVPQTADTEVAELTEALDRGMEGVREAARA